jgi:plasmid stability protein
MASITIRNLDENVKKRLRRQAAENGRSLESEAREILSRNAVATKPKTGLDLIRGIREVVEKYGGVELELPSRKSTRPVNIFEDAGKYEPENLPEPGRKRRK